MAACLLLLLGCMRLGVSKLRVRGGIPWLLANVVICCVLASSPMLVSSTAAESSTQRVLKLNRRATDAYHTLDFAAAELALLQAVQIGERSALPPSLLARTYLNLATVYVAGLQDNARGLTFAAKAFAADANIELDPLTSTPQVRTVFAMAKSKGGKASVPSGTLPRTAGKAPGNIPHTPVPEQLAQTAVPVFIAVPEHAKVGPIYVHYQGFGMEGYRRLPMKKMRGGYGMLIPCVDVYEPTMHYYIVAHAPDGSPMGFAGTKQQPVQVAVVAERHHPAPALPGAKAPQTCKSKDCPPDIPDCTVSQAVDEANENHSPEKKPPRFFFLSLARWA